MKLKIAAAAVALTLGASIAAVGQADATSAPKGTGLPPYWRTEAPSWCYEDMPCWIGSAADGRSAKAALRDWRHQLRIGQDDLQTVWVYLPGRDEPAAIDKATVRKVHACKGQTCKATAAGIGPIYVTRSDFR